MANEFKVNPRQQTSPQTDLPSTNVYGRLSAALGDISNTFGQIATGITVEEQALEGAKARQEGPREKLAPGLTKATQAFNKSFEQMDASLVTMDVSTSLAADYAEAVKPENLAQPGNVERYQRLSRAKIEGALQSALATNRPEIALNLTKLTANNALKIADAQNTFDYKRSVSQLAVNNARQLEEINELASTGNFEQADEAKSNFKTNLVDQVNTGTLLPEEVEKYSKLADQNQINAQLSFDYNRIYKEEGEAAAAAYLNEFYDENNEQTKGLTKEQKDLALASVIKEKNRLVTASADNASIAYDTIMQNLYVDPNYYKDTTQLEQDFVKLEQNGLKPTLAQKTDLRNKVLKSMQIDTQNVAAYAEITKLVNTNSTAIVDVSSDKMTKWFVGMVENQRRKRADNVAAATSQGEMIRENTPDWMLEAQVASKVRIPIDGYTERLDTMIKSGSLEDRLNAVKAYSFLKGVGNIEGANPVAVSKLDKQDKMFASVVAERLANTQVPPELIVQQAEETILKTSPAILEEREKSRDKFLRDRPNYIKGLAKDIYGSKVGNIFGSPSSVMYDDVRTEWIANYDLYPDPAMAAKETKANMKNIAARDTKYGPPDGSPMYNPVQSLEAYKQGKIVPNQMVQSLQQMVKLAELNPNILPETVEWSDKMKKPPEKWTEEETYFGDYAGKEKFYLKIGGKDRQVFLVSPSSKQMRAIGNDNPTYQFYYLSDNNIPRPLLKVKVDLIDGKYSPSLANATTQFYSADIVCPKLTKHANETAEDAGYEKAAQRKLQTADTFDLPGKTVKQIENTAGIGGVLDFTSDVTDEFEELKKTTKNKIKEKVEESQARRAEEKLNKKLE